MTTPEIEIKLSRNHLLIMRDAIEFYEEVFSQTGTPLSQHLKDEMIMARSKVIEALRKLENGTI